MSKRRYTLRKRAARQEETRARIVDAAVALHEELGPANTTISAIAERAGVERLTVYRHFPDEISIFSACSSKYLEDNPLPDRSSWESEKEPAGRTRKALQTLYRYYRSTRRMWSRVSRDQDQVPALDPVMRELGTEMQAIRDDLVTVWDPTPAKRSAFEGLLNHAIAFETWQSLDGEGFDDDAMANLVVLWCTALRSSRRAIHTVRG